MIFSTFEGMDPNCFWMNGAEVVPFMMDPEAYLPFCLNEFFA